MSRHARNAVTAALAVLTVASGLWAPAGPSGAAAIAPCPPVPRTRTALRGGLLLAVAGLPCDQPIAQSAVILLVPCLRGLSAAVAASCQVGDFVFDKSGAVDLLQVEGHSSAWPRAVMSKVIGL